MKTCTRCSVSKNISEFPKNGKSPDGSQLYRPECFLCDRKRQRAGRKGNLRRPQVVNLPSDASSVSKICTACLETKPLEAFSLGGMRNGIHRRSSQCRSCRNAAYNKRRGASIDIGRDMDLWKRYRISLETYNQMLAVQGGRCKICSIHESEVTKRFCVDHDHKCCPGSATCGKCIRGLLCGPCNRGIGQFLDDPEFLRRAADYLVSTKPNLEVI